MKTGIEVRCDVTPLQYHQCFIWDDVDLSGWHLGERWHLTPLQYHQSFMWDNIDLSGWKFGEVRCNSFTIPWMPYAGWCGWKLGESWRLTSWPYHQCFTWDGMDLSGWKLGERWHVTLLQYHQSFMWDDLNLRPNTHGSILLAKTPIPKDLMPTMRPRVLLVVQAACAL